ncbi:unnamed protein product, partial [Mycena citricolor]
LAPNNATGLQAKLMELSTPGNANFRQWLTKEEVKSYMEPSAATVSAFNTFAASNGLKTTGTSPNGDWVSVTLPVSQANELFNASFELFTHPDLDVKIPRTMTVSLPSDIVGVVDVIHPSTSFVKPVARLARAPMKIGVPKEKRAISASCNTNLASNFMNPACLQEIYQLPTTAATAKNNSLLVTGYADQYAEISDLRTFLAKFRPDVATGSNATFALETVDGGENIQDPNLAGGESNLDIQYTVGLATGVPATFLSVGGTDFATMLIDTTTFLDGVSNPPWVMTTSYGVAESTFSKSVAIRICNGFMALGARGISVVFAAGDGGVRGAHDSKKECKNNTFTAEFPAACPFLTSVGSTIGLPETAANFTSGGFSDVFQSPAYQTTQVASFLKTVPSDFKGIFNRTGRGFPDVAVQGYNFELIISGALESISGSSASSPTFAAIVALVNDRLLAAGKPVLGFLNPFLYANPQMFTDIDTGRNTGDVCPPSSVAFEATKGWDPLTGMGTPIFPKLLAAAMG